MERATGRPAGSYDTIPQRRADDPSPAAGQPSEPEASANSDEPGAPPRVTGLLPVISAPKGGGAIRGLNEKISVKAATGTCATAIRVPFSSGRSGFDPALRLSYDSSSGNGPLGFGWSLGTPAITRKTDKGLPRYCDDDESDVFILAGADDLVPVLNPDGSRKALSRTVYGTTFRVTFYRPRIEGLFSRVERWTQTQTGVSHWRTLSKDNVTTLYGTDATCRVADPSDQARIFCWYIWLSWDDKGNAASYEYMPEDSAR